MDYTQCAIDLKIQNNNKCLLIDITQYIVTLKGDNDGKTIRFKSSKNISITI